LGQYSNIVVGSQRHIIEVRVIWYQSLCSKIKFTILLPFVSCCLPILFLLFSLFLVFVLYCAPSSKKKKKKYFLVSFFPFDVDDDSRGNLFEERGNDENQQASLKDQLLAD
jgi:hypothetical protein